MFIFVWSIVDVFCMFNILVLRYFRASGSSLYFVSVFRPDHALIPRSFKLRRVNLVTFMKL